MEVTFPLVSKIAILSFIPLAVAGAVFFALRHVLLIFVGNSEMCCVIGCIPKIHEDCTPHFNN